MCRTLIFYHKFFTKSFQLAGFGKTSISQPKSDLLTEAEYQISNNYGPTFDAENTSGNSVISDLGSGLYVKTENQWVLAGIMSNKIRHTSSELSNLFSFTNVVNYLDWVNAERS